MNQTILLIALFFCHFLADFTHLSTGWMLNAKRLGKPFFPIFCHAFVHATLMAIILEIFLHVTIPSYSIEIFSFTLVDKLFLFQLISHFLIDVLKGRLNGWFSSLQSPTNKGHWVVFGADQLAHAIVIILMAQFACN